MPDAQAIYVIKEVGRNLDKDHHVFYISYLIEIFAELHPEYFVDNRVGRHRTYSLKELLALNTWGDWNNKMSCREKAEMCKNDDGSVQFLIEGQPSKSKINDFTREYKDLIQAFDNFIVEFSLITGLADGSEFTCDGTFIDSYSDDFKALYPDEIQFVKDFLWGGYEEEYKVLYDYYYKLDLMLEDEVKIIEKNLKKKINIYGIAMIILALKDNESFMKINDKLTHMEDNITKDNIKVSIVDPDAHYMKDKDNNWGFHYNFQEITDTKNGIIVGHYVTKNPNDKNELLPASNLLIDKLGHSFFKIAFDNGYWNIPALIQIMNETGVLPIIPDKYRASKIKSKIISDSKSDERYEEYLANKNKNKKQRTFINIDEFEYIKEEDAYKCPVMEFLLEFQRIVNKNGVEYREYWTNKCKKCPHLDKCTSQDKRLIRRVNEEEIIFINNVFDSSIGAESYPKRSSLSEGGFGILFEARNFRGNKVRGIENVEIELARSIIIHNVKKIEKNMDLNVLKKILKFIRKQKLDKKFENIYHF